MKEALGAIAIVVIVVAICLLPGYIIAVAQCNELASTTGKRTEHTILNGCYVEVNGKMIPRDNWRGEYEQ